MKIRKTLSLIIMTALFATLVPTSFAGKIFTDVEYGDSNADAIEYLKNKGVVVGYDDGSYGPERTINRAEFLKIVMELLGINAEGFANCFKDVTTQWFAPYICKAKALGLVDGYPDGYFRPDWDINLVEAAKIVIEAFNIDTSDTFDDTWFQKFIIALEHNSAIPVSIDEFVSLVTRGEMAEMVWRLKANIHYKTTKTYEWLDTGVEPGSDGEDLESITLIDKDDGGGIMWTVEGGDSSLGYKVVWSMEPGPTYPVGGGDQYLYHSDPSTKHSTVTAFNGTGTYYVRVCEYTGDGCATYSNELTMYLEEVASGDDDDSGDVNSITLSHDGDGVVSWTIDGYSEDGFKVVWSKTSGPTYPTRGTDQYQYFSDPQVREATVTAFDEAGTYYVRVCEYLGGSCGVYSNEVTAEL